jgi:hypothetical protein
LASSRAARKASPVTSRLTGAGVGTGVGLGVGVGTGVGVARSEGDGLGTAADGTTAAVPQPPSTTAVVSKAVNRPFTFTLAYLPIVVAVGDYWPLTAAGYDTVMIHPPEGPSNVIADRVLRAIQC